MLNITIDFSIYFDIQCYDIYTNSPKTVTCTYGYTGFNLHNSKTYCLSLKREIIEHIFSAFQNFMCFVSTILVLNLFWIISLFWGLTEVRIVVASYIVDDYCSALYFQLLQ